MTTRRNFLNELLAAGAGFTILPGAGRVWKAMIMPETVPLKVVAWHHGILAPDQGVFTSEDYVFDIPVVNGELQTPEVLRVDLGMDNISQIEIHYPEGHTECGTRLEFNVKQMGKINFGVLTRVSKMI